MKRARTHTHTHDYMHHALTRSKATQLCATSLCCTFGGTQDIIMPFHAVLKLCSDREEVSTLCAYTYIYINILCVCCVLWVCTQRCTPLH
jgi:hypothetical protein